MYVNLKNPNTDEVKQCKLGFSWTMFFFGFWSCVFRADWKWTIITFLLGCCTLSLSDIVMAFLYNKLYVKELLEEGFTPVNGTDRQILKQKQLYFK